MGWKTRENVVVLDFLAVDNFDFTRKIVKKIWVKNSWNVGDLHFLVVDNFDFPRKIEFLDKNLTFRRVCLKGLKVMMVLWIQQRRRRESAQHPNCPTFLEWLIHPNWKDCAVLIMSRILNHTTLPHWSPFPRLPHHHHPKNPWQKKEDSIIKKEEGLARKILTELTVSRRDAYTAVQGR